MSSVTGGQETVRLDPGGFESDQGNPFLLARSEWASLQAYVENALALPTTAQAFVQKIGVENVTPFLPLVNAYAGINQHCKFWKETAFPATVALAADIVDYNSLVPNYYGALAEWIPKLKADPDAREGFKAVCDELAAKAQDFANRAQAVEQQITQFMNDTTADRDTLSPLVTKYDQQYGATSDEVKDLTQKIQDLNSTLSSLNDEYAHDVTVAATSPTYAWIIPFGTIAAAVVAGVYGKRATDALNAIDDVKKKIAEMEDKLKTDVHLMADIHLADHSMHQILLQCQAALEVVGHIKGVWTAIGTDLQKLSDYVAKNLEQAMPILIKLEIKTAIDKWQKVADMADGYRAYAFIQVQQQPQAA